MVCPSFRALGSKRVLVESSPDTKEASLVGPEDMPQQSGKETVSGPPVVKASKMVLLKVRTIKLKDGVDLPPYESHSGPNAAVTATKALRAQI
ncbi:unnamed protein product [Prunus armeniaca]|uniref:Uncharacterized protein n=1 Tax=Prunus armeniaca TaxID=36596 RepID=A0A6J5TXP6_PRUAR|nr:unnamed protein product [Prunus armeniaca]CAB4298960.1 unnamed protein product [Prunus armeniaca]